MSPLEQREKLSTLKRVTFAQVEELAAEGGMQLFCESNRTFRKNGRYTNTYTTRWYKLSSLPDKKFSHLTDVRDFLIQKERHFAT